MKSIPFKSFDPHLWGGEIHLVKTELYTAKLLCLKKGFQSSLHYHKKKDETFFVLFGQISLETVSSEIILNPGDSYRLAPNEQHRFKATMESAFGKGNLLSQVMNYLKMPRAIKLGLVTNMFDAIVLEVSTHDDPDDNVKREAAKKI